MISKLRLQYGRSPKASPEAIEVTPVTIFVGPNNSGKSTILREIAHFCNTGVKPNPTLILDQLDFISLSRGEAKRAVARLERKPREDEFVDYKGQIIVESYHGRTIIGRQELTRAIENPSENPTIFHPYFLYSQVLVLDGPGRIHLVEEQPAGDLLDHPETSFQILFRDSRRRNKVRQIIFEAFNLHFVIDPTKLGHFRVRLSDRQLPPNMDEESLNINARKFYSNARSIEQMGDGVKAFTGIISEVVAGDRSIVLIDEPEAFLHPSTSFALGRALSLTAQEERKKVFISTHSSHLLMGCIQSGVPINVIRLTYHDKVATARILSGEKISKLMRHPLLRSTGILEGLFYESVVVTEADTDRAFYQEINERLIRFTDNGIPNCLFVNAHNKQTIPTIMQPLRELGIPVAGIGDLDVLKEGGKAWSAFLTACNIPQINHDSLATGRGHAANALNTIGWYSKANGGVNSLKADDKEGVKNLLDRLAEYGMFLVPGGELESWLSNLNVPGSKTRWLIAMFERMGEDPERPDYIRPGVGDVWAFMSNIRAWLLDPHKKGIPD